TWSGRALTVSQAAGVPSVATGPINVISVVQLAANRYIGMACCAFSSSRWGVTALSSAGTGDLWAAVLSVSAVSVAAAVVDTATGATALGHVAMVVNGSSFDIFTDAFNASGAPAAI